MKAKKQFSLQTDKPLILSVPADWWIRSIDGNYAQFITNESAIGDKSYYYESPYNQGDYICVCPAMWISLEY